MSANMNNYFGLPGNKFGLIDKTNQALGLSEFNTETNAPLISQRTYLNFFDTRNCIGEMSLYQAQLAYSFYLAGNGDLSPLQFKACLEPDMRVNLRKLMNVCSNFKGYPIRGDSYIEGNTIHYDLQTVYKWVKSIEMINIIIPRDIIPMYVYFPGFINNCIPFRSKGTGKSYINPINQGANSIWESPIPPEIANFVDPNMQGLSAVKLGGVYESPMRYWRTFTGPNSMPNPHTPPPYQLWNPPQDPFTDDPWPFQPVPVRNQRIPTYRSKNGVIFSGYGLYDLDDFPPFQEYQLADGNVTQIPLRKMFLKLIVPKDQYINGISAEELIDISNTTDFNDEGIVDNPLLQTGYGDYQRFVPGPGLGMNYQPNQWREGKAVPIDLTVSTYDSTTGILGPMPVPFPNFRGNVWGPFSRPGDRFQNCSLQLTIDELYLNGDLDNLAGNSPIIPSYDPTTSPYTFEELSLTLKSPNDIVRFQNFETSSAPNIKNSMRVVYDGGYGAVYAYVGKNKTTRGDPGPIITGGLPNTQYDGQIHRINVEQWLLPKATLPTNWIETLPGYQRPDFVKSDTFPGWLFSWRDIYPWSGAVYVPVTAGGTGPMSRCDNGVWKRAVGTSSELNYTLGSEEWSSDPVIGMANTWCIPQTNKQFPIVEYIGNVPWGVPQTIALSSGGSNYVIGNPVNKNVYNAYLVFQSIAELELNSVSAKGAITGFTITSGVPVDGSLVGVPLTIKGDYGDANATIIFTDPMNATLWIGGNSYKPDTNLITYNNTGVGNGLRIDIITANDGFISEIAIRSYGTGYSVGDIITIRQQNSGNNATFTIDSVDKSINIDDPNYTPAIPQNNQFHYHDPKAVGALSGSLYAALNVDYLNGTEECNNDSCNSNTEVNCTQPIAEYTFCVGTEYASASVSNDNPLPNPSCMKKCDYLDLVTPEIEYEESDNLCRPKNNRRQLQRDNYINRRVAYNDQGPNNGALISNLMSYRSYFISGTPDTDIVIRIRNADRDTYVQSINAKVSGSNFTAPIRLNLGTTTGTQEYVEATQGMLTGAAGFWLKTFEPPLEKLNHLTIDLFTFDGTPICIERCLGFMEQIKGYASLFTATLSSVFNVHGSFEEYAPYLPPFVGTFVSSPSSVVVSAVPSSKSFSDPFNPSLETYTQRNLGILFKVTCYHPENPGTTEIIKKIPGIEKFEESETPLASNIDEYR